MIPSAHTEQSPTAVRLQAEYRARREREAVAARKVRQMVQPAPMRLVTAPVKPKQLPLWQFEPTTFTSHIVDYRRWQLAQELAGFGEKPRDIKPSMDNIVRDLLKQHSGFTLDQLRGHRRHRDLTLVRQIAMHEVSVHRPDKSLPEIGRFFNRDHTTVLHAIRKIEAMKAKGEI